MDMADLQTGFTTYPLNALFATSSNVRSGDKRTPEDIMKMALSIAAHGGLLQNLVVVPEFKDGKRTGRAAVTAGETRRLALCLLRDGGVPDFDGIDDAFPVACREVASEEATAASATENIQRTQMHPADQFKAFSDLFDQCGSVEQIAAMFGSTPLVVRQRLKLAAASPRLFELYRKDDGTMTLEQLMALSISDDHAAQERVWDATKGRDWERSPNRLRQLLTEREVPASAPLARFVGIKAYEAAGGEVRRDLFSDEGEGFLIDEALLAQLAGQKLDKTAQAVRGEAWAWVEVKAEVVQTHELSNYTRAQQGMRTLTDAEREALAKLEADHDQASSELNALYDQEEDEAGDGLGQKIRELGDKGDRLGAEISKLRASFASWTPEVLVHAGTIVALDRNGKPVIHRGLVRPEDRKAAVKAVATAAKAEEARTGENDSQVEPKGSGLSEALMRRLTAQRTVALQRVVADNTQAAMAVLAHNLVQRVLQDTYGCRIMSPLDLQAKTCDTQMSAATEGSVETSRAWTELKALREQWGDRIPGDQAKVLPWLLTLPMSELCDLLALCTALTLNAVTTVSKHPCDPLAAAVGLDMADWWEPTGDEYLSRVPKVMIGKALAEAGLASDAAAVEKMKKGEAVAMAEAQLTGKRWLPAPLRLAVGS